MLVLYNPFGEKKDQEVEIIPPLMDRYSTNTQHTRTLQHLVRAFEHIPLIYPPSDSTRQWCVGYFSLGLAQF